MKKRQKNSIRKYLSSVVFAFVLFYIVAGGIACCNQFIEKRRLDELKKKLLIEQETIPMVSLKLGTFSQRHDIPLLDDTVEDAQRQSSYMEISEAESVVLEYEPISEEDEVNLQYTLKGDDSIFEQQFFVEKGVYLSVPLAGEGTYIVHVNCYGVDKYMAFELK